LEAKQETIKTMNKELQEILSMLDIKKIITPEEIAEAVKMKKDGELSSTGMKEVIFGLYKERVNNILKTLLNKNK